MIILLTLFVSVLILDLLILFFLFNCFGKTGFECFYVTAQCCSLFFYSYVLMSKFRKPALRLGLFLVFKRMIYSDLSYDLHHSYRPLSASSLQSVFSDYNYFTACPISCLLQGDYTAAMASLETCLSVLTRALPSTSLDLVCSVSWNLIRYILHRPTPLGWLVHQVGGKHEGEEAQTSARDAALVYHRLSQLQLTGQSEKGGADADGHYTYITVIQGCFSKTGME